ncbi:LysR family transcriptional regulator [Azohydromonas caseinilytica]|uniref:LysR family transcriptional regulator n=1 Tax=Azohydromonas caseinilytica TaxID=2728836 RepID=A0A848F9K9_9BURK|nr:LysR family transcriptional regulator [Azohydromonas caseinilytica]NML14920.1 LysR family transcriptional regulator [Azohydromonas caseinilytica]
MYLKHLQYLQLVIQHGSQAAAARAAGVSQSAIAQAMQALERQLGCVLFESAGRRKLPTAAALQAARRAAELQHGAAPLPGAWDASLLAPGVPRLRVGMAPAAALLYAPAIERHWRMLEPDGLLRIVGGTAQEQFAALERGELELAIVPRPRGWRATGLRSQLLHTSAPFVVARRGHALAQAESLEQIARAGWAVAGRVGTAGNTIEEAHRVRGWPLPRVLAQCADYGALLNLVAHSELLCTLPHPALLSDPVQAELVRLPLREGLPRYEVSAFWTPALPGRFGALLKELRGLAKA